MSDSVEVLDTVGRMGRKLANIGRHIREPFWWVPLTVKQKKVILHAIMGRTYEEIGADMGIIKGSVQGHVILALKKINADEKIRDMRKGDDYRLSQLPAIILGLIKEELTRD